MRTRLLLSSLLLTVLTIAITSAGDAAALPAVRQSAMAYLTEPTLIGSTFIVGPVVFTHDNRKMARGEPCTTVHLFDPETGHATEEMASFHCILRRGRMVSELTITTRPSRWGFGCVLTAYQFAGDPEIHEVPQPAEAH
jgi:hypothetical protein